MTDFEHLNNLRLLNGKKPLKTWKESKERLRLAIDKEEEAYAKFASRPSIPDEAIETLKQTGTVTLIMNEPQTVTLSQIARELGIDPKVARAKARRLRLFLQTLEVAKHTYDISNRDRVSQLLVRDHRK
jgi:predicted DNA-binding ArsR family transcriptional regulator